MVYIKAIRSLSAEEAHILLSKDMWNMFGKGITYGMIIVYQGLGDIHFKEVN